MLAVFEKGKEGDFSAVRFQGTIRKFARECRTDASGTTTIKVGSPVVFLLAPTARWARRLCPCVSSWCETATRSSTPSSTRRTSQSRRHSRRRLGRPVAPDVVVAGDKSQGNFVIYVGFDESKDKKEKVS